MTSAIVRCTLILSAIVYSAQLPAHPSLSAHTHTATNTPWESDGTKDGSSAHNHRANRSFGGASTPNRAPYNANKCWDNTTYRYDNSGSFDNGHCYIDEGGGTSNIPTYKFEGSWPVEAKNRVIDAFKTWSAINTDTTVLATGIGFRENSSANITVRWEDILDDNNGGQYAPTSRVLSFDSSMSSVWNYSKSPSGIPSDKWHFYSVALHEVGHAVGLIHQADTSDLMTPPVGKPAGAGGRHFDYIDSDSQSGIRELYSQPVGSPTLTSACYITLEYTGCPNSYSPSYVVTVFDTSGASGTSMVDVDYKIGGSSSWSDLADVAIGCVGYSGTVGVLNSFKALILTSIGVGQCTYAINIPVDQCDENPY